MEIQDHIFDDFSLTSKTTITHLTKIFNLKFGIYFEGAQLLARYCIENPNFSKDERASIDAKAAYEYDPNKALSHAKIVSTIQSVITKIMMDDE